MLQQLKNCLFAAAFLAASALAAQEHAYFSLEKLSPEINSDGDEITPVLSRDGKTLFFTRMGFSDFSKTLIVNGLDQSLAKSEGEYFAELGGIFSSLAGQKIDDPVRSAFNQDVWVSTSFDGKTFENPGHPTAPLNNALPNSLVACTPDPNEFLVVNQFPPDGGMEKGFSKIRRTFADVWKAPEAITIRDFYTITSDVSLTMSFDGGALILSAARSDSRGDMDLYVCLREAEGIFGAPISLGSTINSMARETTPFLSEDHRTIYFSSNRAGAMGGSDIFTAKRLDETWQNWTLPLPLAEPVNSVGDDSQPFFNMTTGYLYFSSKRDGSSDIFRVQIAPPQPTELTLTGRVLNAGTGDVVKDAVVWYGPPGGTLNPIVSPDGRYSLTIPKGVKFELLAQKTGYTGQPHEAFFRRDYYFFQKEYVVDLLVEPLRAGATIRLNPIFFEQSKAVILPKSYAELERLLAILKENPSLVLRVEGHTENQGREEDLKKLSQERAEAIRDFLAQKGIEKKRVETIGHGSRFPINTAGSEAARAENRRVEFKVVRI